MKKGVKVTKSNSIRSLRKKAVTTNPARLKKHSSLPPAKPALQSSHSMRRPSMFQLDQEHVRALSNSDGLLVVRKKSVWDRISATDGAVPNEENTILPEEKTKKRKYGIVPQFRSDIMKFLSNSRRKGQKESIKPTNKNQELAKNSLLRNAVRRMDTERVKKLLSTKELNIDEPNNRGITVLMEAAIDGNCACLRILVEYGAKINLTDNEGFNALDYAVCGGDFESASFLINNGASESRIRNGLIGFNNVVT